MNSETTTQMMSEKGEIKINYVETEITTILKT